MDGCTYSEGYFDLASTKVEDFNLFGIDVGNPTVAYYSTEPAPQQQPYGNEEIDAVEEARLLAIEPLLFSESSGGSLVSNSIGLQASTQSTVLCNAEAGLEGNRHSTGAGKINTEPLECMAARAEPGVVPHNRQ